MDNVGSAKVFEGHRSLLTAIAYRVLGSASDAADVVQDTFVAWNSAPQDQIKNPRAWLVTVCSRRAIDATRAADRRRVDYVGPWLPDFVRSDESQSPEAVVELDASVTLAFQVVLQRLSARERVAFVLHDVFGIDYPDISDTLDTTVEACRQLVSRARRRLSDGPARYQPTKSEADRLLAAFRAALATGSTDDLAPLLAGDVELRVDSGGKVPSLTAVLDHRTVVLAAIESTLSTYWRDLDLRSARFNGQPGLEVRDPDGLHAAVAFTFSAGGLVTRIDILRNPDKLATLDPPPGSRARHNWGP